MDAMQLSDQDSCELFLENNLFVCAECVGGIEAAVTNY